MSTSILVYINLELSTSLLLSLHDALPISLVGPDRQRFRPFGAGPDRGHVAGQRVDDAAGVGLGGRGQRLVEHRDRKSTRLNSSHPSISYAVFCSLENKLSAEKLATKSEFQ